MRPYFWRAFVLVSALVFLLAGCTTPTSTPEPTLDRPAPTETQVEATGAPAPTHTSEPEPTGAGEEPIYLAIIWHQHQPVYYKDTQTGLYAKPWVRVHATKDYVDMAAMLEQYPDIHATFNLTPSLIRQLDDLEASAKDLYWAIAEIPAEQLSEEDRQFLLDRFFDTNRKIIARFPRYQELLDMRDSGEAYDVPDYRDLQVLFNLAWTDPAWLEQKPLDVLVAKGRDFSEADKAVLFNVHRQLIAEVIPVHRRLQDAGQIEVTMTPFAHPILPLLLSTDLAREAMPEVELPAPAFQYGQDAVAQVELGVQFYEDHFGRPPRGMWPAEGSVAQEIVGMVGRNGIEWMASDEGVLARSLGMASFTRNPQEVVSQADQLYRPYRVQGTGAPPVAMVFRDVVISDRVGFTYSGMAGDLAAQDFINRIHAIRDALQESGVEGPHLVSVILDGENAWEHYDNDGKLFLNSLYQGLSEDQSIQTVTPSEFLEMAPEPPMIEDLWAGSWIGADFSTWIGEEEENRAWNYLRETRAFLEKYLTGIRQPPSTEALEQAVTLIYVAEGSDWFWWYGADQNSGDDGAFDEQFRNTLREVYTTLGEEPPTFVTVPVIPQQPVAADISVTGLITPTIDGVLDEGEWANAGLFQASGGVMAASERFFERLYYGFDAQNLYLAVELPEGSSLPQNPSALDFYLNFPAVDSEFASFSRGGSLLGFAANRLIEARLEAGALASANVYRAADAENWQPEPAEPVEAAAAGSLVIELAVPLEGLGRVETGDRLNLRAVFSERLLVDDLQTYADAEVLPVDGPALLTVPDLGTSTPVLNISDPSGDDYGPGIYSYPTDAVFQPGNFDILNFEVAYDDQNVIFRFDLRGPVENVWDSPNGLSVQTFDVYIDQDGAGEGERAFLPGRNLALQDDFAWDYAVTVEGWESGVFVPGEEGPERVAPAGQISVLADPGQSKVTIRVPMSILGENPEDWNYAAMVLGQEGFPAGGVMRVRDVEPTSSQWRFGGAPPDTTNHTRVIDYVWSEEDSQEAWLSDFEPVARPQGELAAEDFARVPMLSIPNP